MPDNAPITILGSGVALGVYIPALLLRYQLRSLGFRAEALMIEDLYSPAGLDAIERTRRAFHERFDLALVAQRMTSSSRPDLDRSRVDAILGAWGSEGRREFVVWSGFWMPLLADYRVRCAPKPVRVDVCRIDAIPSASFRGSTLGPDDREIWFWKWPDRQLEYELSASLEPPVPWAARDERLVVHGGGWGLGDYQDAAKVLEHQGIKLDRIAYRESEAVSRVTDSRTFMVRPDWRPWLRPHGVEHEMPPFGEVGAEFVNRPSCHELHGLIRHTLAIVSKPGGGTLLDSLSSATPVLFLQPYGEAEQRNAEVWIALGFGMWFKEWYRGGCDLDRLAELHANLANRSSSTIDYPRAVGRRFGRSTKDEGGS